MWHPVEEMILRTMQQHKLALGMQVTEGETCECGYWTGNEEPGRNRPLGVRDALDWHVSQEIFKVLYGDHYS